MNARKGINNVITSILSQLVTLALGIVIPRLVLVNLGSEANGLLSSINEVLVYVALLEAGVGAASLQALYGPVAKDDKDAINGVLSATNYFYRKTGRIYFAVVLLLAFVFPFTLKTSLPHATIMGVMLLSGLPGVINYYFQAKFKLLLRAEGKRYITTNLATIIHVATSISKIVLLLKGYGIIELQVMYLAFNLLQAAFIIWYIRKHYRWINLNAEPDFPAISQSKNVLVHQISGLIFNHTDVLLLTYLCGLKTVSVYSMYTMLLGMIGAVISHFDGFDFILGQTFNTDRKRFTKLQDCYEVYNMALTFSLMCIATNFILPFLRLYTAGINDIDYIDDILPYLFTATYLLTCGRNTSLQAINYARHFKETQWQAVVESILNITISLLCVWKFGIYGVLMGTIAALLFRTNAMILYANRRILHRNPWITYRRWLLNLAIFIAVTVAGKWLFSFVALDSYLRIIGWAIVCCIVVIPLFFGVVSLCEREVFRFACQLLRPYWGKLREKLRLRHV